MLAAATCGAAIGFLAAPHVTAGGPGPAYAPGQTRATSTETVSVCAVDGPIITPRTGVTSP